MDEVIYSPVYNTSHALIIGIDEYKHAPPLGYAVSDATSIKEILISDFDFTDQNVTFLINKNATRKKIMAAFHKYDLDDSLKDDRLLIFYAGHGATMEGKRSIAGYLIPYDGNINDLSTCIRWDELSKGADLIHIKHILFIMDACYGGLLLQRDYSSGTKRFLSDMLVRRSLQVLTAGKANETVSDAGGPLPDHSVFTGHLLEALAGKAKGEEGELLASSVMDYVYRKVSRDPDSHQTPHYGHLDGDGEFIFKAEVLNPPISNSKIDEDILVNVPKPEYSDDVEWINKGDDVSKIVKNLLKQSKPRIDLHDYVTSHIRKLLPKLSLTEFPTSGEISGDNFAKRLLKYETLLEEIQILSICLAYWGDEDSVELLRIILTRLIESEESPSGIVTLISSRGFPWLYIFYSTGITLVFRNRYDFLYKLFYYTLKDKLNPDQNKILLRSMGKAYLELVRSNLFKMLPNYERKYTPHGEYFYKILQPNLEDILFLGEEYTRNFDRFELLFAIEHINMNLNINPENKKYPWGPIGRYGWKYTTYDNPLLDIIIEAERDKEKWAPLKAGFFNGNYERFKEISEYLVQTVKNLGWG